MYSVISGLRRRMGWNQEQLADVLKTNQAQVSRLEGAAARSFSELCDKLRTWIRERPENASAWLNLLAEGETTGLFADYLDLFFISEAVDPRFDEFWVVSELPAECRRTSLRKRIADRIHNPHSEEARCRVVYWTPEDAATEIQMRSLALAFRDDDHLTIEQLNEQVLWIRTPASWTLIPFAITNPLSDKRLGFIAPDSDLAHGVRVVVLPRATTSRLVAELEPRFRNLQHDKVVNDGSHHWRMEGLGRLIEHRAATSELTPHSRKGRK